MHVCFRTEDTAGIFKHYPIAYLGSFCTSATKTMQLHLLILVVFTTISPSSGSAWSMTDKIAEPHVTNGCSTRDCRYGMYDILGHHLCKCHISWSAKPSHSRCETLENCPTIDITFQHVDYKVRYDSRKLGRHFRRLGEDEQRKFIHFARFVLPTYEKNAVSKNRWDHIPYEATEYTKLEWTGVKTYVKYRLGKKQKDLALFKKADFCCVYESRMRQKEVSDLSVYMQKNRLRSKNFYRGVTQTKQATRDVMDGMAGVDLYYCQSRFSVSFFLVCT